MSNGYDADVTFMESEKTETSEMIVMVKNFMMNSEGRVRRMLYDTCRLSWTVRKNASQHHAP